MSDFVLYPQKPRQNGEAGAIRTKYGSGTTQFDLACKRFWDKRQMAEPSDHKDGCRVGDFVAYADYLNENGLI